MTLAKAAIEIIHRCPRGRCRVLAVSEDTMPKIEIGAETEGKNNWA